MSDEKSVISEAANGIRSIFDRIGEFFHIFDLSFFVAGATTLSAVAFLYMKMELPFSFPFEPWVRIVAVLLACYICGLIAFAAGRTINRGLFRRGWPPKNKDKSDPEKTAPERARSERSQSKDLIEDILKKAIKGHGLNGIAVKAYEESGSWWHLYIRMWSELVHEKSSPAVLHHLMRYWAMSATYDGLGFSLLLWGVVLILVQFCGVAPHPVPMRVASWGAAASFAAALISFWQGAAYYKSQIADVAAHYAVLLGSLVPHAAPAGSPATSGASPPPQAPAAATGAANSPAAASSTPAGG